MTTLVVITWAVQSLSLTRYSLTAVQPLHPPLAAVAPTEASNEEQAPKAGQLPQLPHPPLAWPMAATELAADRVAGGGPKYC